MSKVYQSPNCIARTTKFNLFSGPKSSVTFFNSYYIYSI